MLAGRSRLSSCVLPRRVLKQHPLAMALLIYNRGSPVRPAIGVSSDHDSMLCPLSLCCPSSERKR